MTATRHPEGRFEGALTVCHGSSVPSRRRLRPPAPRRAVSVRPPRAAPPYVSTAAVGRAGDAPCTLHHTAPAAAALS